MNGLIMNLAVDFQAILCFVCTVLMHACSFVPRHYPVFQCSTLKNGRQPGMLNN